MEVITNAKDLGPCIIHLDDLLAIELMTKKSVPSAKLKFSNCDFTFDSLDKLKEHSGNEITYLRVVAEELYEITFTTSRVSFVALDESELAQNFLYRLKDTIRKNEILAPELKCMLSVLLPFSLGISIITIVQISNISSGLKDGISIAGAIFIAIAFMIFALHGTLIKIGVGRIILQLKGKRQNFLQRNFDNIASNLVSYVITLIIGGIIGFGFALIPMLKTNHEPDRVKDTPSVTAPPSATQDVTEPTPTPTTP